MLDVFTVQKDARLINSYLIKHESHPKEEYVELAWDSALFFARIILASENKVGLNADLVLADIDEYNGMHQTRVSLEYLLNRFWLRKIFGQIKISGAILRLFSGNDGEIPKDIEDDDLLMNFRFLEFMVKKYGYEDSRNCEVSTKIFDSIYDEFKKFYPQMPELQSLLHNYKILKDGNKYIFRLWLIENEVNSRSLSMHILYSLFRENDPSNDAESLKKWLLATKFVFCPDMFENLSEWYQERYIKTAKELLESESDLDAAHENEKFLLNEDLSFCSFYSANDIIKKIGLSDYTLMSKEPFIQWLNIFSNRGRGVDFLDIFIRKDYVKLLQSLLIHSQKCPGAIKVLELFDNRPYLLYQAIFYLARSNPTHLLTFIDDKRYGLIFFCSFLCLCEDSFNKQPADELIPFSLIRKYTDLFCEKNLLIKENYRDASFLLMFLIEGMYNSKWPALYKNVFERICSFPFFERPTINFTKEALDICAENAKDIWIQRTQRIKICEFNYLFFFYTKADKTEKNQCFDLIMSLYEDSILKNEKLDYWNEWNEIDSLEWNQFFDQLYGKDKLTDFCLDVFDYLQYDEKESDFDKKYSSPKKFRLHLKLLCSVYLKWRMYEPNEKIAALEDCIVKILQNCFVNKIEEKKIAIFDSLYESHWGLDFSTELFPLIVETLNLFSAPNREKILSAMSKGDDLKLMVRAYNLLADEADQSFLKKLMDFSTDVEKSISFFDDYISFLQDVYNSRINIEFADKLFDKLEKNIDYRAKGKIIAPFVLNAQVLKLYSMFWHNDEKGLLEYKCPYMDSDGRYRDELISLENERSFLLTLMYMKNGKNEDAQKVVKRIRYQDSDYFALKYKSFALYISVFYLEDICNYAELLKQCDSLIGATKDKMSANEKKSYDGLQYLYYAKSSLLEKIGDGDKLYQFYNSVEDDYRAVLEFAKPVVVCLLNQGRDIEAFKVCNAIRPSEKEKLEYEALKKSIPSENEISRLASSYKDILCLSKEDRFKVLPDVVCKHRENVGIFIIHSICFCLDKILGKIQTLKQLPEDNKTDLIQIMLESYLKTLNYEFDKDQSRQGLSRLGGNAGELDLVLKLDTYSIVIEAVRYRYFDDNVKEHILKPFKYDSSKRVFVNLMYYENDNSRFFQQWKNVVKKLSNNKDVTYPINYSSLSSEDVSKGFNNASIKVLKNSHENGLTFYHIFVNLNYAD